MIHILGSMSEDLCWASYRFINPKIKTVYAPTCKFLIAEHDVTNIIGSEYTFNKTVKFAAKMRISGHHGRNGTYEGHLLSS